MQYLLLFHGNNCYAEVPQCYVIHTSLFLFWIELFVPWLPYFPFNVEVIEVTAFQLQTFSLSMKLITFSKSERIRFQTLRKTTAAATIYGYNNSL
jgi:hypothetical protein